MKIAILGTGAIGSIIATFASLSQNDHEIHLIGRKKRLDPIKNQGLVYKPYNWKEESEWIGTTGYQIHETIQGLQEIDVVFCAMKAHGLHAALESAKKLIDVNSPKIVLAMNGLGLRDIASEFSKDENIIETIAFYPSRLEGNVVLNTGGNAFFIAEGTTTARDVLGKVYAGSPVDMRFDGTFRKAQWKKAIINTGINAISAITMLPVGQILSREPLAVLIKENIREATTVAEACGIKFEEDLVEVFWGFASKDPDHIPSMQQDFTRHKLTEIAYLNGYIAEKGRERGIATPANEAITCLIQLLEKKLIKL